MIYSSSACSLRRRPHAEYFRSHIVPIASAHASIFFLRAMPPTLPICHIISKFKAPVAYHCQRFFNIAYYAQHMQRLMTLISHHCTRCITRCHFFAGLSCIIDGNRRRWRRRLLGYDSIKMRRQPIYYDDAYFGAAGFAQVYAIFTLILRISLRH